MVKDDCETIKGALKYLYDHLKSVEVEKCKNSVPKLFLAGMDEEALWQQLELQNNFTIDKLVEKTSTFLAMKYDTLKFDYRVEGEQSEEDDDVEPEGDEEQELGDEEDDEGWEDLEAGDDNLEEVDDEEDGEEENDEDDEVSSEKEDEPQQQGEKDEDDPEEDQSKNPRRKKVDLDDDFFKLKELNAFLDEEDRKEMSKSKKKYADEEESGEGIDLFQDLDELDDDDEGAADMKFSDFFEKPGEKQIKKKKKHFRDEEDDEENEDEEQNDAGDRRVKFNLEENQEFSDHEDEAEDPDDPKSTFEERQERLKKRMERLENKSIGDKPWQLKGEVKASSRPENSLLEEYLEFDSATRPAPLITEETTKRLDDIILQRIKDRAYDDVQRKIRPSDNDNEFRKKLVLDQAKSKESLAQIYEKEYLDKVEAQKEKDTNVLEEEPLIKKEIREKMRQLMAKLDALSNYHFTPKPAAPELKIITITPAIEMEEAAPVAVSDATMLAPEEVKRPNKGDLIGRTERTQTDKNRERRRKKLKQRLSANEESASGKMGKDTLEKVTKARNVQKVS